MKAFLASKVGMISVVAFALMMAVVFSRVAQRRKQQEQGDRPSQAAKQPESPGSAVPRPENISAVLMENAAYLDQYYELGKSLRTDHDRQGNGVARRKVAATSSSAGKETDREPSRGGAKTLRGSLRLQGRRPAGETQAPATIVLAGTNEPTPRMNPVMAMQPAPVSAGMRTSAASSSQSRATRFNPYGRVIKCELVFTLDSTNEQTPLVALVVEPVYNNGALVIPAGAELHGVARPDRLRDRIFSGVEWVLVFPREEDRLNGRQLNVRGVALDRIEPDANGMTWGLTDGSYGLEGRIIRTLDGAEIKRFLTTFLAAGTATLEERQSGRTGAQAVRNTPQNAVLQGLAANFEKLAEDISAEIERHGVFIRVPAGHQFYFYPMQVIDADVADISSDIAKVK